MVEHETAASICWHLLRYRVTGINAQYNVARPNTLPVKVAGIMRRQMYERFLASMAPGEADTILDVGATSDRSYDHSNYFEAWYRHKHRITAVGIDDARFLETRYPGVTFRHADARDLPFGDQSFDFVHSSAVLEHVGSRKEQRETIAECWRVARKGIFLTTPNRWFPVEFHSVLPLVHWLPAPMFRAVLRRVPGRETLADEAHLNLLTRREILRLCADGGVPGRIENVAILGWPTNLLLIAKRPCD